MAILITSASRICSFRIVVSAREYDDSLLFHAAIFKTLCLICISDVDEIPRATVIRALRDAPARFVGFRLRFSYFFLNYRNIAGPEANLAWCCAFPREALAHHTPEQLRLGIRDGSIVAEQIDNAGWHFSYLSDVGGIKQKITDFSHQEFNTPAFLDAIDVRDTVRQGGGMFSRPGFVWEV